AQVARTPEAVAVVFEDRRLTYAQLNARANQLAHHLRRLGVGPEVLVGICVERSLEMVVGLLGILKAGGAYVPLDPDHPAERLAFMVEDTQAPVLLTQQALRERLPAKHARVVCLDADWPQIDQEPDANLAAQANADNLAYVIYTSGTTGQPKGVEIGHRGVVNLVAWHRSEYAVTSLDQATQLASLAFDASVWEVWPYLTAGASVHLAPADVLTSTRHLITWWQEERITLSFLPTPLVEVLLTEELPTGLALRSLLTGGDQLRNHPRREYPFRWMNHYGPTENTVVTTFCEVDSAFSHP